MNNYSVGENVPLCFRRILNGTPQTGQTVTVTVFDETTGASVLASQTCPEVVSGQYVYNWTTVPKVRANYRVTFTLSARLYDFYLQVLDDYQESRAV